VFVLWYSFQMKKGIDNIGIAVIPFAHDGQGNYVVGLRTKKCRDEHNVWEPTGGGGLKHGETIEEGVIREMKEELGVTPFNLKSLGVREVFRDIDGQKSHWIMFDYKVQVDPSQVKIMEPDKCSELRWCKPEDIPHPQHSQFPIFIEANKDKL